MHDLVEMTMTGIGPTCWRLWTVLSRSTEATSGLGLGKSFHTFGSALNLQGLLVVGASSSFFHLRRGPLFLLPKPGKSIILS